MPITLEQIERREELLEKLSLTVEEQQELKELTDIWYADPKVSN